MEAPGDIQCFQFNPQRPDIVIGGLANGQVLLWDITEIRNELKEFENSKKVKNTNIAELKNSGKSALAIIELEDEIERNNTLGTIPIQPLILSNIEKSHPRSVTDIQWLPKNLEMNRKGEMSKVGVTENSYSSQFVSVAANGQLLFWDIRQVLHDKGIKGNGGLAIGPTIVADSVEGSGPSLNQNNHEEKEDVKKWTPLVTVPLGKDSEISPIKICIKDVQTFECITEDGDFVIGDWSSKKDEEEKEKKKSSVVQQILKGHFLNCTSLQQSPFFSDIFLTTGDWMFNIWKLGVDTPIFSSPMMEDYIMSACWSPTRPAVFVTALSNGSIMLYFI